MTKISSKKIETALDKLADEIAAAHGKADKIALAAIANGGIETCNWLRRKLEGKMSAEVVMGIIDISFHRDDIGHKPITKEVHATEFFHDPADATIILVDDVLFSGRTVRAAMAEVHALGRPSKIELAVLVDRGNRKLPIEANYIGMEIDTDAAQKVEVEIGKTSLSKSAITIS